MLMVMRATGDFFRAWWVGLAGTAPVAACVITIWALAPQGALLQIALISIVILLVAMTAVRVLSRNRTRARVYPRVAVLKADLEQPPATSERSAPTHT